MPYHNAQHLVGYYIPASIHTSEQEKPANFGFGNQLFMSRANLISVEMLNRVQN